mgnify:CR=1 FL=1
MSLGILDYSLSELAFRVGVVRSLTCDEPSHPHDIVDDGLKNNVNPDVLLKVVNKFRELEQHTVEKIEHVYSSLVQELYTDIDGQRSSTPNSIDQAIHNPIWRTTDDSSKCADAVVETAVSETKTRLSSPLIEHLDAYFHVGASNTETAPLCPSMTRDVDWPFRDSQKHAKYLQSELRALLKYILAQDSLPDRVRKQLGLLIFFRLFVAFSATPLTD